MEKIYKVRGGKKLKGEIELKGAKNVATKVIIASLLAEGKSVLENIPQIGDVEITLKMCESLGVKYRWLEKNVLEIDPSLESFKVPLEYSGKNRVPILFFGPLLHRFQKVEVPMAGGCPIGQRPVDFHINGYQLLGAKVIYEKNIYYASCEKLKGTTIELNYPSVGATENLLLGAVLAEGTTVIRNAAIEPEIEDLVLYLQSMGAIIYQDVNRTWIIEGVKKLKGSTFKIMNDRIEAASFASLAMANKSDIFIKGVDPRGVLTFLNYARKIGASFELFKNGIRFYNSTHLKGIALETDVHPGFMTDWQPPFSIVLTQAEGVSIIHETVYENRFGYVSALNEMGAKIYLFTNCLGSKPCRFTYRDFPHSAIVVGPTKLQCKRLEVPDLRAGFSYLIASLIAEGESEILGIEKIERGYENIKERLQNIGAEIKEEIIEK
ncbi:MAG: UDP-N-acetylglucosamine 1-carboxyvinyltransferase [Candidatus Paceibacterota bacterium]